jgi:hypothetical protein
MRKLLRGTAIAVVWFLLASWAIASAAEEGPTGLQSPPIDPEILVFMSGLGGLQMELIGGSRYKTTALLGTEPRGFRLLEPLGFRVEHSEATCRIVRHVPRLVVMEPAWKNGEFTLTILKKMDDLTGLRVRIQNYWPGEDEPADNGLTPLGGLDRSAKEVYPADQADAASAKWILDLADADIGAPEARDDSKFLAAQVELKIRGTVETAYLAEGPRTVPAYARNGLVGVSVKPSHDEYGTPDAAMAEGIVARVPALPGQFAIEVLSADDEVVDFYRVRPQRAQWVVIMNSPVEPNMKCADWGVEKGEEYARGLHIAALKGLTEDDGTESSRPYVHTTKEKNWIRDVQDNIVATQPELEAYFLASLERARKVMGVVPLVEYDDIKLEVVPNWIQVCPWGRW